MKKLLFSLTNAERKEVLEKYLSKQPEPLNRQFLERKSKDEAVKDGLNTDYTKMQKRTTI